MSLPNRMRPGEKLDEDQVLQQFRRPECKRPGFDRRHLREKILHDLRRGELTRAATRVGDEIGRFREFGT